MQQLFMAFVENPSVERFLEVREAVIAGPDYVVYHPGLKQAAALYDEQDWGQLAEKVTEIMPNFLLSPSLHFYLGRAAGVTGDTDIEALEKHIYKACRESLLATGDGTVTKPYLPTHIDDEYEVMAMLDKAPVQQSLVKHTDGRVFDVMSEESQEETWFDITALIQKMGVDPKLQHYPGSPSLKDI